MEMLPQFMHTPLSHKLSKRVKSRPAFIVSIIRLNEGVHETRKTHNWPNQIQLPTFMKPKLSFQPEFSKKLSELKLLEKLLKTFDRAIIKFIDPPLHLSVDPSYILSDNFAPVDELSPTECKVVHGSIPKCLDGVYIRNGPNPRFVPNGPHHYLDGDGMLHSIKISQGLATLCSRYVKTNKYLSEDKARSCVVPNIIGGMQSAGPFIARMALFCARIISGQYDIENGIGVANTNLAFFGGSLYALCESDLPYALKVQENGDIITLGLHDCNGKLSKNMTAHIKIDPETKEAFAFRYWATRPYLTYFHFDANGNKQPDVPIFSMDQPSLTHDLAITKKYAVICDIQLGADPMNLIRGRHVVSIDRAKVPRIGLLPRYAKDESNMKWFDVPGFNIFHAVNAWDEMDDEGNEVVVMVAPNILSMEHFLERVDLIQTSMEKVTINIGTGVVSRQTLSTDNLEFPVINPSYISKKNRYIYAAVCEKTPVKSRMMRTIGVAKLDITLSEPHEYTVASRMYGDNCYGGEPFFVARDPEDLNAGEDDGYLVSYVHNETSGESRFLVMDARSPTLDYVAAVNLPQRVPYGLHGIFIREKDLV
uniref:probable carotenoid cleavage dioxygenase 4, chloroplastic n=1 Tax=Erigeron canadensis TaxID=72917 RepID=UPI001CB8F1EF|nr:probable carotenoid cleavage dioxygenase 4, chloroplastic [Erigeron canadensis]